MLKRVISYESYANGDTVTETFYFHLGFPEVLQLEKDTGGWEKYFLGLIETKNTVDLAMHVSNIIERAYGVRYDDGQRFAKTPENLQLFKDSPAFEVLLVDLLLNPEELVKFLNSLVSDETRKRVAAEMAKMQAAAEADKPTLPPPNVIED